MTVAAGAAKAGPYTGNDSASSFAFSFKVFADGDIRVVETLIATEVETDLVLNTNYTVTRNVDQDNSPGGTITYKVGGVTTALPSTKKLTIVGDFDFSQPADIPNGGAFFANVVETALDRCTSLIKQLKEKMDRAVTVNVSSSTSPDDLIDSLVTAANDAEASAVAAALSETNAGLSETAAALSETNAATYATAAQTAANAMMWTDVAFKTAADSPVTVQTTDTGKMFAVDCSGGAVTINLPAIAGLNLSLPWVIGIKKTDASGNAITVNRASTDTIDGGTSKSIGSADSGAVFIPDTDPTPDEWTTAEFGTTTGNLTDEVFTDGVGFTAGASTTLTLSQAYGSEQNIAVHFDAAFQGPDTYSLSGTTLTFSSVIPLGVSKVYVKGGTTLSIGTPADGTVSTAKIVDNAVTLAKTTMGTGKLLGRTTAGSGAAEEITVGSGLSLSGGSLTATGSVGQQMVRLNTANGYGSTNNKIRRFTNTVTNTGSDITYADSAANGGSFTINTAGIYAISYSDQFNTGSGMGLSLNTANATTSIRSCPVGEILTATQSSTNYGGVSSWTGYLPAASVIRAHTDGDASGTSPNVCQFTIVRVA